MVILNKFNVYQILNIEFRIYNLTGRIRKFLIWECFVSRLAHIFYLAFSTLSKAAGMILFGTPNLVSWKNQQFIDVSIFIFRTPYLPTIRRRNMLDSSPWYSQNRSVGYTYDGELIIIATSICTTNKSSVLQDCPTQSEK